MIGPISNGQRIVDSINYWLAGGPLGDNQRPTDYRKLISAGQNPALQGGGDIGTVRTSCAIFGRAILHDSGVMPVTEPGKVGWPMWGGWLGELSTRHPAWVPWREGNQPKPGSLFYIESPANPNNNHVGFWVEPIIGTTDAWKTAEGGGGDGTQCTFHVRKVQQAQQGRLLKGWFDPELIGEARPPSPISPSSVGSSSTSSAGALIAGIGLLRSFLR